MGNIFIGNILGNGGKCDIEVMVSRRCAFLLIRKRKGGKEFFSLKMMILWWKIQGGIDFGF